MNRTAKARKCNLLNLFHLKFPLRLIKNYVVVVRRNMDRRSEGSGLVQYKYKKLRKLKKFINGE
jgi:hypothetical protein